MALGNAGGPGTVATFESECGECFELIEVGDRILQREGVWGHFKCPDQCDHRTGAPLVVDRWDGTDPNEMGY